LLANVTNEAYPAKRTQATAGVDGMNTEAMAAAQAAAASGNMV